MTAWIAPTLVVIALAAVTAAPPERIVVYIDLATLAVLLILEARDYKRGRG